MPSDETKLEGASAPLEAATELYEVGQASEKEVAEEEVLVVHVEACHPLEAAPHQVGLRGI
jgi:hypothetical protein